MKKAQILTSYMLCAEVDDTRRCAVKSMEPSELRDVVAETPRHPLAKRVLQLLDMELV